MSPVHPRTLETFHRISFIWYDMLGTDVFTIFIIADHGDMVVGSMFKLASSDVSAITATRILIKDSPHNRSRRI